MGRLFFEDLEGKTYNCKFCKTQLARADQLISKAFHCSSGRAYLLNKVVNTTSGETEERTLPSGTHTVTDIFCRSCGQILGWKYEKSHEESQKYKEGKFVLERVKIIDDDDDDDSEFYIDTRSSSSDDEDEDTV